MDDLYERDNEFWGEYICACTRTFQRERHLVDERSTNTRGLYRCCNQCYNKRWIEREYPPVPDGWMPIVRELHEKLTALHPDYRIAQIKEKFGGLRYYVDAVGEEAWKLIESAEGESYETCQNCGEPGESQNIRGWYQTLCKHCYADSRENVT
jgi:hypothetical protein